MKVILFKNFRLDLCVGIKFITDIFTKRSI